MNKACLLLCLLSANVFAEIRVPAVFGDHMVLQQECKLPIWGWADPNEEVTVEFAGQKKSTRAGADGRWRVDLEPVTAGTPAQSLHVGKLRFDDVLVGDVWVASGQSNMEFQLARSSTGGEDLPKAHYPQIRFFQIPRTDRVEPQADATAKWVVCSPQSVGGFSAVAYYFASELSRTLQNRPIGVIGTYWGGTPAQAWVSLAGLKQSPPFQNYVKQAETDLANWQVDKADYPKLQEEFLAAKKKWDAEVKPDFDAANKEWSGEAKRAKEAGRPEPVRPQPKEPQPKAPRGPNPGPSHATVLFNGMIHPVIPYAIKGAIWYQGESNASLAEEYRGLFRRLIQDWRAQWGQGDFPFLFVQLAGFGGERGFESYALLREAQTMALQEPNTGMAVAMDIGDEKDIHPKNKKDVGLRLAESAKVVAYGLPGESGGPLYEKMKVEGDKIRISFKQTGSGLESRGSQALTGFQICGSDRKWFPAEARIDRDTVLVSAKEVRQPVAVRYGWGGFVPVNLYNKAGLPASPFRTDDWPRTTEAKPNTIPQAVEWNKRCAERVASFQSQTCDVIFIGDSITQNFWEGPQSGWGHVGGPVWEREMVPRKALNFGVGGDSIANALWRMDTMPIQNLRPKVAVIMLGMNNHNDSPEDVAAGIEAVIGRCQAFFPGVKIVLMSVTANGRMPEKTLLFNDRLRALADDRSIFYVDLHAKMPAVGAGWKGVAGDKVHLTPEGYELWAAALTPLLDRLLKS